MTRRHSKSDLALLSSDLSAPLPAPKRRSQEESKMQRALLAWWKDNHVHFNTHEWMLFSVPNGGGRSGAKVGAILKLEGLRKGVPDLFLARMSCGKTHGGRMASFSGNSLFTAAQPFYAGLFLELKTPTGIVSAEQMQYHSLLQYNGYRVEIIRSLQQGIDVITSYLT